jgi:arylsulfatase A
MKGKMMMIQGKTDGKSRGCGRWGTSLTISTGALALGATAMGGDVALIPTIAGLSIAMGATAAGGDAVDRPNIVFILTDDQGWPQTSVAMDPAVPHSYCPYLETPHIERLAREGMLFTDGYAPAPICTPTRRSVLCGMTTARQRGTEFPSAFDPREHLTIPGALKALDPAYRCAHFGKWGESMEATPEESGYDESDGITGNHTGDGRTWEQSRATKLPKIAGAPLEDPKLTFSVTDRAVDFMSRCADASEPFYLQVSYYAMHDQIQATAETIAKYRAKGISPRQFPPEFAAMLDDLDAGIGRLLQAIDDLDLEESTYVFFASDNGGTPHQPGHPAYQAHLQGERPDVEGVLLPENYPLRGAKQYLYEGGIRVPFIVRGPGIRPGSLTREPVILYDLLPTFAELAGGQVASLPEEIDGGSLVPLLYGRGSVHRPLPGLVFHRPLLRFRGGKPLATVGFSAYRAGDMKLVIDWVDDTKELFNLREDPGELHDLAVERPQEVETLFRQLTDYLDSVDAEKVQAQLHYVGLETRNEVDPERAEQLKTFAQRALRDGRTP